ncbi:MAG TPA: hypothetical protein VGS04_02075 [Nitrososphaerales archaeon]|nr:hypothetical protein [Nitrososphaerales archaeon]
MASRDPGPALAKSVRAALGGYLQGRKLVEVKMRQAEGRSVDGFLKIQGEKKGERLLVDFKAVITREGTLSSLEVAGRKVSLAVTANARRTR